MQNIHRKIRIKWKKYFKDFFLIGLIITVGDIILFFVLMSLIKLPAALVFWIVMGWSALIAVPFVLILIHLILGSVSLSDLVIMSGMKYKK